MGKFPLGLALLLTLAGPGDVRGQGAGVGGPEAGLRDGLYAEFTTPRGVVISELFYRKAPMTCASFVGLAEGTLGPAPRRPFFNGLSFNRVVPGFVVQGGDNLPFDNADPGYWFPDEIVPGLHFDGAGVMAMGNENAPDTNSSEFFFTLGPIPRLDYAFSIFGHAVRGQEVLALIRQGDPMKVRILRIGSDAERFRVDAAGFAALVARAPRLGFPHFNDSPEAVLPADQPWQARYFETKLANLQRATGARVHVLLRARFDREFPAQTPAGRATGYRTRMALPPGANLAVYFAAEDQWVLADGGTPGITLPRYSPRGGPPPAADQEEALKRERRRVAGSVNEVINGLIGQFEAPGDGPAVRPSRDR